MPQHGTSWQLSRVMASVANERGIGGAPIPRSPMSCTERVCPIRQAVAVQTTRRLESQCVNAMRSSQHTAERARVRGVPDSAREIEGLNRWLGGPKTGRPRPALFLFIP